jgi:hypothetical protein
VRRGKDPAERARIRRVLSAEAVKGLSKVDAVVSPQVYSVLEAMLGTGLYGASMPDVVREVLQRASREFLLEHSHLLDDCLED